MSVLTDIDECATMNCEQSCMNTEGSFSCSCDLGYKLLEDGFNCKGTIPVLCIASSDIHHSSSELPSTHGSTKWNHAM